MAEEFLRFYNMRRNPVAKGLPTDMAHPTEDLRQVHARLSHLARTGGIGLITADPGAGKTFAVRTWADGLNPNTNRLVYLCLSTVTNMEFYRELCQGLGVEPCFKKSDMFRDVQACVRGLGFFGSGPMVTMRSRPSTSMLLMSSPEGVPSHQRLSGFEVSLKTTRSGG